MGKFRWPDRVRNESLHKVKEKRDSLHTIKRRKANWIGHILHSNCLLKQVIQGKNTGKNSRKGGVEEDVSSYWMTLRKREDIMN